MCFSKPKPPPPPAPVYLGIDRTERMTARVAGRKDRFSQGVTGLEALRIGVSHGLVPQSLAPTKRRAKGARPRGGPRGGGGSGLNA